MISERASRQNIDQINMAEGMLDKLGVVKSLKDTSSQSEASTQNPPGTEATVNCQLNWSGCAHRPLFQNVLKKFPGIPIVLIKLYFGSGKNCNLSLKVFNCWIDLLLKYFISNTHCWFWKCVAIEILPKTSSRKTFYTWTCMKEKEYY